MKITTEHYKRLEALVTPNDTEERRAVYRIGNFPRSDLVHDLNKRYRWDLIWEGKVMDRHVLINEIYKYANDDHIDTALRKIVKPL